MARYVLSHRRAGIFDDSQKVAVREEADRAFSTLFAASADLVGKREPREDVKREVVIFDASPEEVESKRAELGGAVLLEPEILHYRETARPLDLRATLHGNAAGEVLAGHGNGLRITVRGPSGPLAGAEVALFLRAPGGLDNELKAETDGDGEVAFEFGPSWSAGAALVLPAGDHWSAIVRGPVDGMTVELSELPQTAPAAWWHDVVGHDDVDERGRGVTVGVADTGLGPHPHLGHATNAGAFVGGVHHEDPEDGHDVDSHGTHVCGTIGARTEADARFAGGVAPEVELFGVRVFPAGEGANQGDIANAIEHLSRERHADLINLSLGAPRGSEIERDAIADALERGTLCVCAAGNSNGPVGYPAAFDEAIAVSALGLDGWGAPGSLSAIRHPERRERYGSRGLFLANFSCFGPEIDCAAPGVGIVATVPQRQGLDAPYGAMDGTSMASPVACAALAVALSGSPDYLALPRDLTRSAQARAVLGAICGDIGLAPELQGGGLPWAGLVRCGQA